MLEEFLCCFVDPPCSYATKRSVIRKSTYGFGHILPRNRHYVEHIVPNVIALAEMWSWLTLADTRSKIGVPEFDAMFDRI